MKSFKFALAALLLSPLIPLSAHAEMFKCKMPDGTTAYQDHTCAPEAERKELRLGGIGGTPLANTIGEFVMIHVRRGARFTGRNGRGLPANILECVLHRDSSSLAGTINASIHALLTNDQIAETNRFLTSPVGQKYAEEAYTQARAGSDDFPRTVPHLSSGEQAQFNDFLKTETGAKAISGRGLTNIAQNTTVIDAAVKLVLECVAR